MRYFIHFALVLTFCFSLSVAEAQNKVVVVPLGGEKISGTTSYVWISGNGLRPYHQSDSTIIDMMNNGGARIYRGGNVSNKNVMLPITIVGPSLGQAVRVTGLDIYWKGQTESDNIAAVLMRRQTGVNEIGIGYESLLSDHTVHICNTESNGCTIHYDITDNNTLSENSGILYLTFELSFSSDSTVIQIGGARLTLIHE